MDDGIRRHYRVAEDLDVTMYIDPDDEDAMMIAEMTQNQDEATNIPNESAMAKEIALYMSTPRSHPAADILEYWRVNEHQFPLLAKVVKKYFCLQASSASSEQTFSTSGNIVTPRRKKLDPENVNMLVYLKGNLGKVKLPKQPSKDAKEKDDDDEEDSDEPLAIPVV